MDFVFDGLRAADPLLVRGLPLEVVGEQAVLVAHQEDLVDILGVRDQQREAGSVAAVRAWPSRQKCETGTNSLLKVGLAASLAALGAGELKSNEVAAARLAEGGVDEDAMWGARASEWTRPSFFGGVIAWPK